MNAANERVLGSVCSNRRSDRRQDRASGRRAGETGFPEEVLDRVQAVASVQVAVPVIEAVATPRVQVEGSLLILGVDLTGDRSLRDYDFESGEAAVVDDPLVFLAQPDSIIIASQFAEKAHLVVGSTVVMGTMVGERRFIVRGIMKAQGLATRVWRKPCDHGHLCGAEDVRSRPDVRPDRSRRCVHGHAVQDVAEELQRLLGPGFRSSRRRRAASISLR